MKICKICKKEKDDSTLDNSKNDGLSIYCRDCLKEKNLSKQRSLKGLVGRIYGNQKTNSKRRGHKNPEYSLIELREWLLSQEKYHTLHKQWVESGYKRGLSPSCDRIDDSIGYSLDNIQLMTWNQNKDKGHKCVSNGSVKNRTLLNGGHKPVVKMTLDGEYICTYISTADAARNTFGSYQANISACCSGRLSKTAGYRWRFAHVT